MTGVETPQEILNRLRVVMAQSRGMSKPTLLRQQVDMLYRQYATARRVDYALTDTHAVAVEVRRGKKGKKGKRSRDWE